MNGAPFAKIAWLGAVRRCIVIPAAQRLVIEHIGDTADRNGMGARMSTDRVTAELGVSPETVKRARSAATQNGLWVVVSKPRRGRPRAEGGNARAAEYRLTAPDKRVSGAPITGDKEVSDAPKLGQKRAKNGSVETTPSGSSSGSSSVKQAAAAFGSGPSTGEPRPAGDDAAAAPGCESESSDTASATASDAPTANDAEAFWAETDPAAVDRGLITEILNECPPPIAEQLRRQIANIQAQGWCEDRDISGGLFKWRNRPDLGPNALPNLVGDAWRDNQAADAASTQLAADRAANTAADATRKAIDNCTDCDDYGRLSDLTDCPRHANFRRSRVS
ncbi:hypothetical protein [Mycolicibacterium mageritense]|uniref:Helix-turn-helix domain-containing protein n=1 Tax=Mycolicibacterium mageritense TaxID=53462 RepID=A0AAI8TPM3_MYCME|nr:hypothetical protein [Mycolicibacterium mageritense]BDY26624.1 hypothetical protein hbim_00538 [Mycolicibacterium mageritense]